MEMEKENMEGVNNEHETGESHGHHSAALKSEADLQDHAHDTHDDDDHKVEDYSTYSKKQLTDLVKELSREDNFRKVDTIIKEIKPLIDEYQEKERAAALERFKSDGSVEEDFEYKGDELDNAIDANLRLIKDRRSQHYKQQEEQKTSNLQRKQDVLEKLRELVDSPDSENQFEAFKSIQNEWKSIGSVPGAQAKTLWANYHALVDRFYDKQSIYFELKELDRKRNLEAKIELCVRAERLIEVTIIKDAIRELNELHHEFKHIGPVPIEEKENVWQRFKAASDAVYAKRDEYLATLQQELTVNLDAKLKLCDEVIPFGDFQTDRIKEWNVKTKEILEIQKRWELVGGLPRVKAKDVNKKFWTAFKTFFNNKNTFFKKLDEEREQNLQLKKDLVARAQELKESSDWESTSNELKSLQARWKDVGPVPEKFREKIFQEFKEACDFFFEQRRTQHGKVEDDQKHNLELKKGICDELAKHVAEGTATLDILNELREKFNEIGFVPKKDINSIRHQFSEVVEKFVASLPDLSEDEKSGVLLESEMDSLKGDPFAEKKIYHKEQTIRKKITKLENDISVWKNNLEFFANSKSADKYKEEFQEKIQTASDHLGQLKQQLRVLRTLS